MTGRCASPIRTTLATNLLSEMSPPKRLGGAAMRYSGRLSTNFETTKHASASSIDSAFGMTRERAGITYVFSSQRGWVYFASSCRITLTRCGMMSNCSLTSASASNRRADGSAPTSATHRAACGRASCAYGQRLGFWLRPPLRQQGCCRWHQRFGLPWTSRVVPQCLPRSSRQIAATHTPSLPPEQIGFGAAPRVTLRVRPTRIALGNECGKQ